MSRTVQSALLKRGLEQAVAHRPASAVAPAVAPDEASNQSEAELPAAPSIVITITAGQLPRALITDARGVTTPHVMDYVDLLSCLDESVTIKALETDPVRVVQHPPLPDGALFVDTLERRGGSSYVVTGVREPATHPFALEAPSGTDDAGVSTHLVALPWVCYRAEWDQGNRSVRRLSLALCSPELTGRPARDTPLYRYPFSNCYTKFQGVLEGVCWPAKHDIDVGLAGIPEKIVDAFFALPNNPRRYTQDLSSNAPTKDYRRFLEIAEREGELLHDWLEPAAMTVEDLHLQRRRDA